MDEPELEPLLVELLPDDEDPLLEEPPLEELEPPEELLLDEDDPLQDELPPEELEPPEELLLDDEDGAVMLAAVVALVLARA